MLAIHGAYYDNNFGDLLLLKIFENWAIAATGDQIAYPLVPGREQSRFSTYFPDAAYGLGQRRSWNGLIYGGGGHFGEPDASSRKGYKGYRSWSLRFFLRHVLPAELCIRQGIPYAIAGVGVGPLSNPVVRRQVQRIFHHAAVVSVRDAESQQFVQQDLGVALVKMVPDAALTISHQDIPAIAQAKVSRLLAPYQGMPLLGIHHPRYILADTPAAETMRQGLLAALTAAPDVVPVVFADDGNPKVSQPCDDLAQMITGATGKPCLAVPFKGLWDTVALISQLSAVVTTKLHVSIVAYALGRYGESFAVHPKVERFYRQIGRSPQCMLLRHIDQAITQEKVACALAAARQQEPIQDATWRQMRAHAAVNRAVIAGFLGEQADLQAIA